MVCYFFTLFILGCRDSGTPQKVANSVSPPKETHISVKMNKNSLIALIKENGAIDITPGLSVVGPNGTHPLYGLYWEFRDYDAIISIATSEQNIMSMTYWNKEDFTRSKSHRSATGQEIVALILNHKHRSVSVEYKSPTAKLDDESKTE